MKVHRTPLPGVVVVEPSVFRDERGFFVETYNDERFARHGLPHAFRQDNHSRSHGGVLRGLHYQLARPQGKLVTVIRGAIFDVAADVRTGSPTFGQWYGVTLDADDPRALWIPPGFAHGFCALSDVADIVYKCTELWDANDDRGIIWSDATLGIDWPVASPILSRKDAALPALATGSALLPHYAG